MKHNLRTSWIWREDTAHSSSMHCLEYMLMFADLGEVTFAARQGRSNHCIPSVPALTADCARLADLSTRRF